jgi:hypothetical protein
MMGRARRAGVDRLVAIEGETLEEYGVRFLGEICASAEGPFLIFAGCIVPEGVAWSPEVAEATAKHVEALTSEEDKTTLWPLLASMVIAFFGDGVKRSFGFGAFSRARPRAGQ